VPPAVCRRARAAGRVPPAVCRRARTYAAAALRATGHIRVDRDTGRWPPWDVATSLTSQQIRKWRKSRGCAPRRLRRRRSKPELIYAATRSSLILSVSHPGSTLRPQLR
jgi:hypothetical protein